MTPQKKGKDGEINAYQWLKSNKVPVSLCKHCSPFDLLINGHRAEVKTSSPNSSGIWRFNIHRHGKLDEQDVDYYLLNLAGVPGTKKMMRVILPAPLKVHVFEITFHTLLGKHSANIDNLAVFKEQGDYGKRCEARKLAP